METERWAAIVGFEGRYSISDQGCVRSEKRWVRAPKKMGGVRLIPERIMHATPDKDGYARVCLRGGKRSGTCAYVHRLVARAFIGQCPIGMEVRHADGSKQNNVATNLSYGTQLDNAADRDAHGTTVRGERQWCAKLTSDVVKQIRADRRMLKDIAAEYGLGTSTVWGIRERKSWRHVP